MGTDNESRKWYKKKGYIVPLGILGTLFAISLNTSPNVPQPTQSAVQAATIQQTTSAPEQVESFAPIEISTEQKVTAPRSVQDEVKPVTSSPTLSNDNYYTNTNGNEVHSPAYTSDNNVPANATARCGDGTYSFSQSRRGTCSHHGGVAEWY